MNCVGVEERDDGCFLSIDDASLQLFQRCGGTGSSLISFIQVGARPRSRRLGLVIAGLRWAGPGYLPRVRQV